VTRYTKMRRDVWNAREFSGLSDNAKLVYFLISTSPHQTPLGAMRATIPGLAAELGWTPQKSRPAFKELVAAGLIEVDESANYVGIPDFFELNRPENPNVLKSWIGALELLPDCALKHQLFSRLEALAENLGESFAKAFRRAFPESPPKSSPNQEQEQEQEQEKTEEAIASSGESTSTQQERVRRILNIYPEVGPPQAAKWLAEWNEDEKLLQALRECAELGYLDKPPSYVHQVLQSALKGGGRIRPTSSRKPKSLHQIQEETFGLSDPRYDEHGRYVGIQEKS